MKKCEFCQEPLEENVTVCPHCGKDVAETAPARQEAAPEAEPQEAAAGQTAFEEESPAEKIAEFAAENQDISEPEKKKLAPSKIALAVGAIVVLAAVLIALIVTGMDKQEAAPAPVVTEPAAAVTEAVVETVPATVPADGDPSNETCKGSYTVSDEEVIAAKDTVVATIGDKELTNGQLQVYYWSIVNNYLNSESGYMAMMYGMLDYTKPLDTQISFEDETLTWQQFFVKEALNYWQLYVSLAEEALANGMEMSDADKAYLDTIETSLEQSAASYNVTVEDLMRNNFGAGAGVPEYRYFQELMLQGVGYYQQQLQAMKPDQADLEDFFARNEDVFTANNITRESRLVDVRHILIGPDGGTVDATGALVYSEEEWAAGEAKAQEVLDQWLAGEKTEESFAALANERSQDPGSNTNGGLYQGVYMGQMVKPFEDWCFDAARQHGDYGIVKTDYGYHVMFYVDSELQWPALAEEGWVAEQSNKFLMELADKYPITAQYENMVIGHNGMGAN